jgi:hypothetical protein
METNHIDPRRHFEFARLQQIKRQVLLAVVTAQPFIAGGRPPPITIQSFGDLLSYGDAATLGSLQDRGAFARAVFLRACRDPNGWSSVCSRIRALANAWISQGEMRVQAFFLADTLSDEEIRILLDDTREAEARAMIEDFVDRVCFPGFIVKELRTYLPVSEAR